MPQRPSYSFPTGLFGIASFVTLIGSYAVMLYIGVEVDTLAQFLVDIVFPSFDSHLGSFVTITLWTFIIGNLLLIGFASALEQRHTDASRFTYFATRFLMAGALLFVIETALTIGLIKGLAPAVFASEDMSEMMRGASQTFFVVRNHLGIAAGLSLAAGGFLWGLRLYGSSRILGALILLSGILGLAGAFWPLGATLSYFRTAGYLLFMVGAGIFSIRLLSGKD